METQTPPEDYEYYNQKLTEELEKLQVDLASIRKLAVESFIVFISHIAAQLGLATEQFLKLFGPLFYDDIAENPSTPENSSDADTGLES